MHYQSVRTTCPYCAVGCNMVLQVLDNKIIATLPAKSGPTNEGRLCIKGWRVHEFIQDKERLTTPSVRRNGQQVACSWEEGLTTAAAELNRLKTEYGPESVVFVGSARCTNEETDIFQKMARAVFGHNHIDHCARL